MRVCLVGATHPSGNPRLLREADSLAESGHNVRVVAPCFIEELRASDGRHLVKRKWTLESFDFCRDGWAGRRRSLAARGRKRLARSLFSKLKSQSLAEQSYTLALKQLGRIADREPADYFIAHAHAALPIAAKAARRWNSKLGFDCEDLLSEFNDGSEEIVRRIEEKYLPLCEYVSVPSQSIGLRMAERCAIKNLVVLYNVFPLKLARGMTPPAERPTAEIVRLHWFSQTIGAGRGIEEAIEAMKILNRPVELHLRGSISEAYRVALEILAKTAAQGSLIFHPPVDHDELIKTMEAFDIGLALERNEHNGAAQTVSNKLFTYMIAGLAIAATDTPGQREIMDRFPSIGFLYPAGDPRLLAAGLHKWIDDRSTLRDTKQAAWNLSRSEFCWELAEEKLFSALGLQKKEFAVANPNDLR